MSKNVTLEQQLPYMTIGTGANRSVIRDANKEVGATLSRETYMIPIANLFEREGFNVRERDEMGDIEALAKDIVANGLNTPLTVDLVTSGKKQPRYCVDIGHRRYAAIQLIKEWGLLRTLAMPGIRDAKVECFVNKTDVDELTRIKRLFSSNHHEPLSPLQRARVCERLKVYYAMSSQKIGDALGISRQSVDNYLLLAGESDDIKQAIKKGDMSLTAALSLIRNVKDSSKRDEIARESKETSRKLKVRDANKLGSKIEQPDEAVEEAQFSSPQEEEDDNSGWEEVPAEQATPADRLSVDEKLQAFMQHGPEAQEAVDRHVKNVEDFLDRSNPDGERKEEYQLCQRVVTNCDKIDTMVQGLPKQHYEDIHRLVNFIQKDMEVIMKYVKRCKK